MCDLAFEDFQKVLKTNRLNGEQRAAAGAADRILEEYLSYLKSEYGITPPFKYQSIEKNLVPLTERQLREGFGKEDNYRAAVDILTNRVMVSSKLRRRSLVCYLLHEGLHLNSIGFDALSTELDEGMTEYLLANMLLRKDKELASLNYRLTKQAYKRYRRNAERLVERNGFEAMARSYFSGERFARTEGSRLASPKKFKFKRFSVAGASFTLKFKKGKLAVRNLVTGKIDLFDIEKRSLPITLGRDSDNDIRVEAYGVSPHHAKIEIEKGKIYITDLGSKVGIYVNGDIIEANKQIFLTKVSDLKKGARLAAPSPDNFNEMFDLAGLGFMLQVKDKKLVVRDVTGNEYPFDIQKLPVSITIGRSLENMIRLDIILASRKHARIDIDSDEKVYLINLTNDDNRTTINKKPTPRNKRVFLTTLAELRKGARLAQGQTQTKWSLAELRKDYDLIHSTLTNLYVDINSAYRQIEMTHNKVVDYARLLFIKKFDPLGRHLAELEELRDKLSKHRTTIEGLIIEIWKDFWRQQGLNNDQIAKKSTSDLLKLVFLQVKTTATQNGVELKGNFDSFDSGVNELLKKARAYEARRRFTYLEEDEAEAEKLEDDLGFALYDLFLDAAQFAESQGKDTRSADSIGYGDIPHITNALSRLEGLADNAKPQGARLAAESQTPAEEEVCDLFHQRDQRVHRHEVLGRHCLLD